MPKITWQQFMTKAQKYISLLLTVATLGATLVFFQNCSPGKFHAENQSSSAKSQTPPLANNGNGGFDGKVFVHQGRCGASLDVDTAVEISNDLSVAHLIRKNCASVAPPYDNVIAKVNTDSVGLGVALRSEDGLVLVDQSMSLVPKFVCVSHSSSVPTLIVSQDVNHQGKLLAEAIFPTAGPLGIKQFYAMTDDSTSSSLSCSSLPNSIGSMAVSIAGNGSSSLTFTLPGETTLNTATIDCGDPLAVAGAYLQQNGLFKPKYQEDHADSSNSEDGR